MRTQSPQWVRAQNPALMKVRHPAWTEALETLVKADRARMEAEATAPQRELGLRAAGMGAAAMARQWEPVVMESSLSS